MESHNSKNCSDMNYIYIYIHVLVCVYVLLDTHRQCQSAAVKWLGRRGCEVHNNTESIRLTWVCVCVLQHLLCVTAAQHHRRRLWLSLHPLLKNEVLEDNQRRSQNRDDRRMWVSRPRSDSVLRYWIDWCTLKLSWSRRNFFSFDVDLDMLLHAIAAASHVSVAPRRWSGTCWWPPQCSIWGSLYTQRELIVMCFPFSTTWVVQTSRVFGDGDNDCTVDVCIVLHLYTAHSAAWCKTLFYRSPKFRRIQVKESWNWAQRPFVYLLNAT